MTTLARLGNAERMLLRKAPLLVWLGVTMLDTIPGSIRKEAEAFEQELERAAERYRDDDVVRSIAQDAVRPSARQRNGHTFVASDDLLAQLRRVSRVAARHLDASTADKLTSFLVELGWAVARASAEAPVGSKVSVAEERFLYAADRALRSELTARVA